MRAWFSSRNLTEVEDDTNYLQAVYDDECEILRALTTQASQVEKLLGKNSKGIFSASTGESTSQSPLTVASVVDEDSLDGLYSSVLRVSFRDVTSPKDEITVAPVEEQGEWESRKLWHGVARGIREGNFETAATFKRGILLEVI
ncbi:hypothetical protein EDB19DRAFT_1835996 [Suillus lakei]|nr:hypothetical protein EDB19DRAFT_1835996 [Suillus lakei]